MVRKHLSQLATCGESRVNAIIQRYTRTCIRDPGDTLALVIRMYQKAQHKQPSQPTQTLLTNLLLQCTRQ